MDYGFPVDFNGKADGPHGFEGDEMTEDLYEVGVADRAVRNIRFRLDGADLTWTRSDEVVKTGEKYEDEETGEIYEPQVYRLWTYTVLDIPAGQTVVLEVSYDVLCCWQVYLGNLGQSPLSRYFPTGGDFSYDFSPAQHWGNGKADTFYCTIHGDALQASFFHQDSPFITTDLDFTRSNKTTWTCHVDHFDFAEAGSFRFNFYKDYNENAPYVSWGHPLTDCAVPVSAYTVKTSGAQKNYPASNLVDGDLTTAWVAPGDGVGTTIDIDFPTPRRVSDLGFYNGYDKSEALWAANSRVERVLLEITRADGYRDEPVEVDVSGWDERHYTLRNASPQFGDLSMLVITNLTRQLSGREKGIDDNGVYLFDKVPFKNESVSHIRITILSVTPGTKYSDLCISDILVLDGFED